MSVTPTVKQYGLSQASGSLASIVDGDAGTGWAPIPDELLSYTANFLGNDGLPNSAASFPGFEFDFGTPVRIPTFLFQTETGATLGRGMLILSNNPASSPANMVQSGDVLMGIYSQAQLNAGRILETAAKDLDLQGRYLRLVFRTSDEEVPDTTDPEYVDPSQANVVDASGPFAFIVPDYDDEFVIEGWGGGASGGLTGNANAGGQTSIALYSLIANGGGKSPATVPNAGSTPAAGGTASGGNAANTTGGAGGVPNPLNGNPGFSGNGGDAPNGGLGGVTPYSGEPMNGYKFGVNGAAPGGGGSGRIVFFPGAGGSFYKYHGGAAGGYFKHVLHRGVDGPNPGDVITGFIGAGGTSNVYDGAGANGRVKFSYTLA